MLWSLGSLLSLLFLSSSLSLSLLLASFSHQLQLIVFPGILVIASLLKSSKLFFIFWPTSIMLYFYGLGSIEFGRWLRSALSKFQPVFFLCQLDASWDSGVGECYCYYNCCYSKSHPPPLCEGNGICREICSFKSGWLCGNSLDNVLVVFACVSVGGWAIMFDGGCVDYLVLQPHIKFGEQDQHSVA